MPKQVFTNGVLTIELDPNDSKDAAEISIRSHRGNSISTMTPAQTKDLLTALNEKYSLGLQP